MTDRKKTTGAAGDPRTAAGRRRGGKPPMSRDFAAGDPRTAEAARRGGIARAEKIARFRSLREAALALRDARSEADPAVSNGVAAVLAMYRAASEGDSRCAAFLASLMGEMVERVDVQNLPVIRDDVPRAPDPPAAPSAPSAPPEGGDA